MFKKSLIPIVVATALVGCGGDDNNESANSPGSLVIVGDELIAGTTLTTTLSDPDQIQTDTLSYVWTTGSGTSSGDSYTITEADEGATISVSAAYTDGNGVQEGVGDSTGIVLPTLDVFGYVFKGAISGASCDLFSVGDDGVASDTADASATSDSTGLMSFIDVHFVGTGLISCTGGTYVDESTGATLDAPALRSVVNVIEEVIDAQGEITTAQPNYVVSPLTEIVVQSITNLNDFSATADTVNGRFGIRFDTTGTIPTEVGVVALGADGAEDADRYGSVLALLSQFDADDTDRDMAAILADLAVDLQDGAFSQETLDAFETAQENLQTTSQVANDVNIDLLNNIGAAVGYNNEPVTAIIEGDLGGTIENDATEALTGTVIVTDPNFEEDQVIAQTDVTLTYGSFSIEANGNWSYTLDVTNETVAGLATGDSVRDNITISSVDGTEAVIDIRIAALTQVVKITDPGSDTGEIRYNFDGMRQGKLTAKIYKENSLGSDGNQKDAYITLYGSSGSSSESLVDLRIQGEQGEGDTYIAPRFFARNTDSSSYPGDIVTAPFNEDQFYDVDITWDMDASEQITITIDGEVIGGGAFSTAAVVDSDFVNLDQWFENGVQRVQFRYGDNDRTIPFGAYYVDDIVLYSDTDGTTQLFADDFESYVTGNDLSGDDSPYSEAVYSEVIVFDAGDGEVEPTPAVFFDLTGVINSDATEPATGTVSVLDPDEGEAFVVAGTTSSTFGVFSIEQSGDWTYTLDTSNATIAAMVSGDRETDAIAIQSIDGTMAEVTITIVGVGGATGGANQVAVIVDTLDSDTGELRYALGDGGPLAQGKVTAKVKRLDDDLGNGDAFITLFNENTNNNGAILDLRIRDSSFGVRSPSDVDTSAATVLLDQFMNIEITWEYPNGDTTVNPLVTVSVDGVRFTTDGFTPDNESFGGVTHVAFRFGDNSGVREPTGKFTVDDFFIFSDTAGTTEVFSDDFESYLDGDSLDTDNPASPYNSSTSEATIETEGEVGGPGTPGNKIGEIRDTDSGDTGELRYALGDGGPLAQGRFEVALKRLDDDLGNGDAFITLFNEATNNNGAILDLRIRDDSFGVRSPSDVDTSAATVVLDQFMDIVVTWEYPDGDTSVNPLVTVSVDGVRFTTDGFTPTNDSVGGVTHVAVRFGDNSGVREETGVVSVDNLAVYSDTAGTTEVFADDFEGYAEGDSLDTDNPVSPYNSSTSEAVVAVEE